MIKVEHMELRKVIEASVLMIRLNDQNHQNHSIKSLLEDEYGTLPDKIKIMSRDLSTNQKFWVREQDS